MATTHKSKLGFLSGLATTIGLVVGGGLWATPVVAGALSGPSIVLLLFGVFVLVLLAFPLYATLVKVRPISPGQYYYITRLLLPENKMLSQLLGWLAIWGFFSIGGFVYLQYMVAGGASFLNLLFPMVSTDVFTALLLTVSCATVWFGLRAVGRVEIVLAVLLLIAIGVFVAMGVFSVQIENLTPIVPNGPGSLFAALALLYTLGGGALNAIDLSGEIDDAGNTVPKLIVYGTAVNVGTAAIVSFIVVGVAKHTELAGQTLAFIAQQYMPPSIIAVVAVGAVLAGVSTNIGSIALFNRYAMAAADDGILPDWIGAENKHGEPKYLIVLLLVESVTLVFFDVSLQFLVVGFAFAFLHLSLLMAITGVRLPSTHPEIFEHEEVNSSRILRPTVVRISSLAWGVFILALTAYNIYGNVQGVLAYGAILLSGVILYLIRWQQLSAESLVPSKTLIEKVKAKQET